MGQANACCADLFCRDYYARPPILRTLQVAGAPMGMPPVATAFGPQSIVQQSTMVHTRGPAVGYNVPGAYPAGQMTTTVSKLSGGPSGIMVGPVGGYAGPVVVPRDPRIPMANIDMY